MNQTTAAGLALLILVGLFVVFIRRRYGNLYQALGSALERRTGVTMAQVARVLGLATLAAWALVYLLYGQAEEEGLDSLFKDVPNLLTPSKAPQ